MTIIVNLFIRSVTKKTTAKWHIIPYDTKHEKFNAVFMKRNHWHHSARWGRVLKAKTSSMSSRSLEYIMMHMIESHKWYEIQWISNHIRSFQVRKSKWIYIWESYISRRGGLEWGSPSSYPVPVQRHTWLENIIIGVTVCDMKSAFLT